MPKLEVLPSREERAITNRVEEAVSLRDFDMPRVMQWRQDPMRGVHSQETEPHSYLGSGNEKIVTNGTELFDQVYGRGVRAFRNAGTFDFEFVTNVTQYSQSHSFWSGSVENRERDWRTNSRLRPSWSSAGQARRRRAYSVNSTGETESTSISNTAYNHTAREEMPSLSMMQFGSAQFLAAGPPPAVATAPPQPTPLLPVAGVSQPRQSGQPTVQLDHPSWSQQGDLEGEQLAEGVESGEFLLVPPTQQPVIGVLPRMCRRCSI